MIVPLMDVTTVSISIDGWVVVLANSMDFLPPPS